MNRLATALLTGAYLTTILLATWAIENIGTAPVPGATKVVPVGFGLEAPAAVYFVGLTLVLRDLLQRHITKPAMFALIGVGAALSALINPAVALASGLAFLASESVDYVVFTALQRRGLVRAVLASNAVSIVVDSIIFLTVAFGSTQFLPGQVVGKALATLAAVGVLVALRAVARRQPVAVAR